jgi:beta-glucosidase
MGLNSYRFSISWSRILPDDTRVINQAGINHYNKLIDILILNHIKPLVSLYHWDLPQYLEDEYSGWLNSRIEVDFNQFADICFLNFGDRVKQWITINEPLTFINKGYIEGIFPPGRCSDRRKCKRGNSSTEGYLVAHNVLNSHANVVNLYKTKYQLIQQGNYFYVYYIYIYSFFYIYNLTNYLSI